MASCFPAHRLQRPRPFAHALFPSRRHETPQVLNALGPSMRRSRTDTARTSRGSGSAPGRLHYTRRPSGTTVRIRGPLNDLLSDQRRIQSFQRWRSFSRLDTPSAPFAAYQSAFKRTLRPAYSGLAPNLRACSWGKSLNALALVGL